MPDLKTYDLFISHAWKYGDEYDRLVNLLNSANNFNFRNYSAPVEKPLETLKGLSVTNKTEIKEAIKRKISPVNAVLIISGMYYNYRDWMEVEIEIAKELNKPIIAVRPFGNTNMPFELTITANEVVAWNTDSIVSAIRRNSL